jgi:heme/copper-type cytochrome/quinol oxidase subunit 3
MIRIIVIVALVLIVGSLATALYYLYHDRGQGKRMVKALAIRVALSASLLIFLLLSYRLGWIGEQGLR